MISTKFKEGDKVYFLLNGEKHYRIVANYKEAINWENLRGLTAGPAWMAYIKIVFQENGKVSGWDHEESTYLDKAVEPIINPNSEPLIFTFLKKLIESS